LEMERFLFFPWKTVSEFELVKEAQLQLDHDSRLII